MEDRGEEGWDMSGIPQVPQQEACGQLDEASSGVKPGSRLGWSGEDSRDLARTPQVVAWEGGAEPLPEGSRA